MLGGSLGHLRRWLVSACWLRRLRSPMSRMISLSAMRRWPPFGNSIKADLRSLPPSFDGLLMHVKPFCGYIQAI